MRRNVEISPTNQALAFIRESYKKRTGRLEEVEAAEDHVIRSIVEMASGIWYEDERVTKDGTVKRRVYRRAPNIRAVELFCKFSNLDPSEWMEIYSKSAKVDTDASLATARIENLKAQNSLVTAQEELAVQQTRAYKEAFIPAEEIKRVAQFMSQVAIHFWQSRTMDEVHEASANMDDWQKLMQRFGMILAQEYRSVIGEGKEMVVLEAEEEDEE